MLSWLFDRGSNMDFVTNYYRDHVLFVRAFKSVSVPGRYLARFIAAKDGAHVVQKTAALDFATPADANQNALRLAKEWVDKLSLS